MEASHQLCDHHFLLYAQLRVKNLFFWRVAWFGEGVSMGYPVHPTLAENLTWINGYVDEEWC